MARTAEMKLLELMVLKDDISAVIEYIGKKGTFQFQKSVSKSKKEEKIETETEKVFGNIDTQYYEELTSACNELGIEFDIPDLSNFVVPSAEDRENADKFLEAYNSLQRDIREAAEAGEKINSAYKEALSFSNLQVSYSELEHLTFLSLRIGKIPTSQFDDLKDSLEGTAVVIALGDDKSHVLVASSKKGRFALDSELKNHNFVPVEIPSDFTGVPEDVLDGLRKQKIESDDLQKELATQKKNFSETHEAKLIKLLGNFAIGVQIETIKKGLESTELVYRVTGWIPASESESYMKDLDNITEGRIAIRQYETYEVPSVMSGKEKVPVKLEHGKLIKSFERMIFSYGSPVYGSIDPSPFVAIFFTILFGIMFGDLGQGLFFVLVGILLAKNVVKVGGWNKFAPIFLAIGISSSVMGLLTGEFFGTEKILEPFSLWVTGLFGTPRPQILHLMPSSDPNSIYVMFGVFGVAVGIGFIINTCGLVINIINNFLKKNYADAIFGKNGIAGAVFFWYVILLVISMVAFHHKINAFDIIMIAVSMFFAAFASPFQRKLRGEEKAFENGFGTYLISSLVEVIEVISGYLSNTISFVRVGAFALSHAVLNFTILTLTNMCGGPGSIGGIIVLIIGNAVIIVLEGMIVAIQVIRLQYYEFFSKFFHETGREFKPFKFQLAGENK